MNAGLTKGSGNDRNRSVPCPDVVRSGFGPIIRRDDVERGDNAEIERRSRNCLTAEYAWLISVAKERRRPMALKRDWVIKVDQIMALGDIDPFLHQRRVGFAIGIFDDPVFQAIAANRFRIK